LKGLRVACGAFALCAVTVRPAAQQQPPPVFRAGVEVVRLDVSVTKGGVPVRGLTARDFSVTDSGVPQDVESATLDQAPLDVQMVLDVSGSVSGERLTNLMLAAHGLLRALRPPDAAGLLTFADALRMRAPMTRDLASVRAALPGIVGEGRTALRDAVQLGLALRGEDDTRGLMLVFTDGVDNASWLSDDAVLESARRAGEVVHVVRVSSREDSTSTFVEQVTTATGGRVWSASSNRDLEQLFTRAFEEMRARYTLTFSPRGVPLPGWHELKVKLKGASGDIVARPGYFVSS
jgi:VWFA-related protein